MLIKISRYEPPHSHGSVVDGGYFGFRFASVEARKIAERVVREHDPRVSVNGYDRTLVIYHRLSREIGGASDATWRCHSLVALFSEMFSARSLLTA